MRAKTWSISVQLGGRCKTRKGINSRARCNFKARATGAGRGAQRGGEGRREEEEEEGNSVVGARRARAAA